METSVNENANQLNLKNFDFNLNSALSLIITECLHYLPIYSIYLLFFWFSIGSGYGRGCKALVLAKPESLLLAIINRIIKGKIVN